LGGVSNQNLNSHALRHHYASKCILLGIPQKYITELMGHSSTDMTEKVYHHIFPSAMEVYSDKLRDQMTELCNMKNNSLYFKFFMSGSNHVCILLVTTLRNKKACE